MLRKPGNRQTFSRHRDLKPGLWDDSIDSSVYASARLSRPALRPMVNDNIVFNNSSSYNNSVDATEGRVTFKWRNAKEDTFGALFCWCEIQTAIKNIQDSNWHCPNGRGGLNPFQDGFCVRVCVCVNGVTFSKFRCRAITINKRQPRLILTRCQFAKYVISSKVP